MPRSAALLPPPGPTPSAHAGISSPPIRDLRIGLDVDAGGWVVLPEWFGVWVAGGGTLSEIDQDSGEVRLTGTGRWDYDFVQLARYGEGTILLASGSTLWSLDASSGGVVRRNDLEHVGSVDAVINTRSGTWVAASEPDGGVLARIDLDTGAASRRVRIGHGRHQLVTSAGYLVVGSQDPDAPGDRPDRPADGGEAGAAPRHGIDRVRGLPSVGNHGRPRSLHRRPRRDQLRRRPRARSRLGGLGRGQTVGALGDGFDVDVDLSARPRSTGDGDARRRGER